MTHRSIGRSEARVDAVAKVTGTAIYPGDRSYSDQLWMKILFAGRPHLERCRNRLWPDRCCVLPRRLEKQ